MKLRARPALFPTRWSARNNGHSILEYATVLACVVAALMTMNMYITRGFQGRLKVIADEFGQQYSPRHTNGTSNLSYNSTTVTEVETLSESEFRARGYCFDFNEDGDCTDTDAFGSQTLTYYPASNPTVIRQTENEHVAQW